MPQAVRVDWLKQKVYWTNGATNRIERSNFDGTGKETILTGSKVQGLAVDPTISNNTRSGWSCIFIYSELKLFV